MISNFTMAAINALPVTGKDYICWADKWDHEGSSLGCRVSAKGGKSYVVQYYFDDPSTDRGVRTTRKSMGKVSKWRSVTDVKAEAKRIVTEGRKAKVSTTEMKRRERKVARDTAEQFALSGTLDALHATYAERRAAGGISDREPYADGGAMMERCVRYANAVWGKHTALRDLGPEDAETLITKVQSEHGVDMARKVKSNLKELFSYGFHTMQDTTVPVELFARTKVKVPPPKRVAMDKAEVHRWLTVGLPTYATRGPLEETRETDGGNWAGAYGHIWAEAADALLWVFLTASRQGSVLKTQRGEIDLEARTWHRPASKMKMRRAHTMHALPDEVIEVMRRQIERREIELMRPMEADDWLFPNRGRGDANQTTEWRGDLRYPFQNTLAYANIEPKKWSDVNEREEAITVHTLRSTAVSLWHAAGETWSVIGDRIGTSARILEDVYGRDVKKAEEHLKQNQAAMAALMGAD